MFQLGRLQSMGLPFSSPSLTSDIPASSLPFHVSVGDCGGTQPPNCACLQLRVMTLSFASDGTCALL